MVTMSPARSSGTSKLDDVGFKGVAVDRTVQDERRNKAMERERAGKGGGLPMTVGDAHAEAFAPKAAAVAASHIGGRPGLVPSTGSGQAEDQALGIEIKLPFEAGLAQHQNARTACSLASVVFIVRVLMASKEALERTGAEDEALAWLART